MFECPVPLYRGSEVAIDGGLDIVDIVGIVDIGREQSSKFTKPLFWHLIMGLHPSVKDIDFTT